MHHAATTFNWNSDWDDRYRALSYENVIASTESMARRDPSIGATVLNVGKGYAAYHGRNSATTAASSIGVHDSNHEEELAIVEDFYLSRGCTPRFWTNPATHPDFLRLLHSRGYRAAKTANTWIRLAQEPFSIDTPGPIRVGAVDESESQTWIDTVGRAFMEEEKPYEGALPKESADVFYAVAFARGFTALLAYLDDVPAGGGVLAQGHGIAILRTASTRFHHRGKGVQKALIATRLQWAREQGSQVCLATTSPAPNDNSARNMARFGFHVLRSSALMEKPSESA